MELILFALAGLAVILATFAVLDRMDKRRSHR